MEIKPLTSLKTPPPYDRLLAMDIETASDGSLLDIGQFDGSKFTKFSTWHHYLSALFRRREGSYRILAHNGFGFDYIGLLRHLISGYKTFGIREQDITFLSSASLMVGVIVRKGSARFTFVDTVRFFPGTKLQSLASDFLNDSKRDVSDYYLNRMEIYKAKYPKKYYRYLEQDCILLYRIYETFREEINNIVEIGELGMSSGSTAMKCFRRHRHEINPRGLIYAPAEEMLGAADYALRGGFTAYIGNGTHDNHLYRNVNSYDVISMYPSIMLTIPVPTSPLRMTSRIEYIHRRVRPGWYLCEFKQKTGPVPFLYDLDGTEPVFEGTGLLTHYDVELMKDIGSVKCIDGIVYDSFEFAFRDLITSLLTKRLQAKSDGQKAKATALKIILNSLYGKFAQSPTREIIAITSSLDLYESMVKASIENEGKPITEYYADDSTVLYGVQSDSTSFSNRFIGGMITAFARMKLALFLNTYPVIYCDTDSIFTQTVLDDYFIGNEAGYFELDARSPNDMICLGKKSYQYDSSIKFKGIPRETIRNNRRVETLTREDIETIRQGGSVKTEYRSPTAFKTAMKQNIENPNQFLKRNRSVKRGLSFEEKGMLRKSSDYFSLDLCKFYFDRLTFKRII